MKRTLVERDSPAIRAGVLTEHVGIETEGGVLTPLLFASDSVPCDAQETFGTAKNGQTSLLLRVYRGSYRRVRDARSLGSFRIENIPPEPAGARVLLVTFSAAGRDILVSAIDAVSGVELPIRLEAEPPGWRRRLWSLLGR